MDIQVGDRDLLDNLMSVTEGLIQVHDVSALLDKILYEARRFTNSDAGSIFLTRGKNLAFSYVHNDTLLTSQESNKYLYQDWEIPVDTSSLCGYVAVTGQPLKIDDAYDLDPTLPFCFNRSFDQASGYRTRSVLAVPLRTSRGGIVGVLQLINAQDPAGQAVPFSLRDQAYVSFFANNAALAVERAIITRELILRTAKMAELRDPKETGPHVNRVGAYAAEIYQSWARRRGLALEEIKRSKDIIRVAAMQHDVGKVAISDAILKKPGKLSDEEFHVIKYHTIYGAQLFSQTTSEVDAAAQAIVLNHHERWDGSGYPGRIPDIFAPNVELGPGLRGEEIPLFARVTALADVYDALISARVYKPAFSEDKVLEIIHQGSGNQFDPEVVEAFLDIYEVIRSIHGRYPEEP
ncbi:MAG: HD domain-containing protein [Desulfarculus sp.]|nr:HD domain-containing protein [Desulfarculus sp.]